MTGGEQFERSGEQHVRIITDARIVETSVVTFPGILGDGCDRGGAVAAGVQGAAGAVRGLAAALCFS